MLKNKKQLLGLAGLVAVGIMTAIAYAMPTPDAAAIDSTPGYECDDSVAGKECASTNNDINVNVTINEATPSATILAPQDGSTTVESVVGVSTNYSQVTSIKYELYYGDNPNPIYTTTFNPSDDAGTHNFTLNLANLNYGYGEYTLKTQATGINGGPTREDTVKFNYEAITAGVTTNPDGTGDVNIDVTVGQGVDKVTIYVYDEKGELVKDKDGNDLIIKVDPSEIDPSTGKVNVKIPFEENGLPGGEYTAVIIAQDKDDNILSMVTLKITYKPVTPDTPNTGLAALSELNITRLDYILTGLIAFSLVAAFALYLVFRKNHRS